MEGKRRKRLYIFSGMDRLGNQSESGFIVRVREVEQRGHCLRAAEMGNMYLNIY